MSVESSASPRPPITVGGNVMILRSSTTSADVANWNTTSSASSGSSPNCSWTSRCSRTSQKKSGEPRPTAVRGRLPGRAVRRLAATDLPCPGPFPFDRPVPPKGTSRGGAPGPRDQTTGSAEATVRIPTDPRPVDPCGLVGQHQTGASPLDRAGAQTAGEAEKSQETWLQAWSQRQQLRRTAGAIQERCVDV